VTSERIYVESDFFLALIKSEDWLKKRVVEFEKKNRGNLVTSVIAVAEVLLVAKKYNLDAEKIVSSIFELSLVEGISPGEGINAARLIMKEKIGVFDALHAVLSRERKVASSEHLYDKLGKRTIKF
jgi:hypothetical protein